jgi:hemoglobin
MKTHEMKAPETRFGFGPPAWRALRALFILLLLAAGGCWGGGERSVASSGDPEADRRADQRVGAEDGQARDGRTLYERLGGDAGVVAIVEDMTARVIADPRVNFERRNVRASWLGGKYDAWNPTPENVERFKRHMIEFLMLAAGGPAEYTGRDIAEIHKGMKITNNEFDAMVGDIKATMDKLGLATREKRDVLAIIETTRKQIVEKQ